jgi:hypothetical protein
MQSKGLGDDIKKITSATGLDQTSKKDCPTSRMKIVDATIDKLGSMTKQRIGLFIKKGI